VETFLDLQCQRETKKEKIVKLITSEDVPLILKNPDDMSLRMGS